MVTLVEPRLLTPPLKWAGGKRWLVPHLLALREYWGKARLVEPFVGGMAISLGLRPNRALLNDANPHLINFYKYLQSGLECNEIVMDNSPNVYYDNRKRFNTLISTGQADSKEAAELFYYLNRTCFNGLCRFNSHGLFNVPYGKYKTINYTWDFKDYRSVLENWELQFGDFDQVKLVANDVIYADPPYDVQFTTYSSGGFNWDDQVRLANWLANHEGPVIASNQATERVLELYEGLGFRLHILQAPRMINSTGDRTPAIEMLATRNISLPID